MVPITSLSGRPPGHWLCAAACAAAEARNPAPCGGPSQLAAGADHCINCPARAPCSKYGLPSDVMAPITSGCFADRPDAEGQAGQAGVAAAGHGARGEPAAVGAPAGRRAAEAGRANPAARSPCSKYRLFSSMMALITSAEAGRANPAAAAGRTQAAAPPAAGRGRRRQGPAPAVHRQGAGVPREGGGGTPGARQGEWSMPVLLSFCCIPALASAAVSMETERGGQRTNSTGMAVTGAAGP